MRINNISLNKVKNDSCENRTTWSSRDNYCLKDNKCAIVKESKSKIPLCRRR